MPNRLTVAVVPGERSAWDKRECQLLVDGQDLVAQVFDEGPWQGPDRLLGPTSPLLPTDGPQEVMLAEAVCTWLCCGAVYVRVRRDRNDIVWDRGRNPDDEDLTLPEVRFDVVQYEAELLRHHG